MAKKVAAHILIAIDIAKKIKNRSIKENDKLKGRSLAASDYNVSSETIRKAFNLLADNKVIKIHEKSGSTVISRDASLNFLSIYNENLTVRKQIEDLEELRAQKKAIEKKENDLISKISKKALTTNKDLLINIFEVLIHDDFEIVGKKMDDIHLWKTTGSTIFGVISENTVYSSIPVDYEIKVGDRLIISGEQENLSKTLEYLKMKTS